MTIKEPYLCTKLEIWYPKYSSQYDGSEPTVLLAKYKVLHATPTIIINFTKAQHLKGQRYAIRKSDVLRYDTVYNGKIECYNVPMSALEYWETGSEVATIANNLFKD